VTTQANELKQRTKEFAIRIIKLFRSLPKTEEARIIGRQVLRSGTSVAANYRATCRARSRSEFVSKLGIVVEEADETVFWLELLVDADIVPKARMEKLLAETNELLAVFAASQRTAKYGAARQSSMNQPPNRQ
jgi:four helix bundle protein